MYDQFNTIENHQFIPQQAFLYFPTGDSTKEQQDDFKAIYANNQLRRFIYEGGIDYTEKQNKIIYQFYEYLQKKNIVLQKQWSKALVYKFLQSSSYDYKKSIKQIMKHDQYQKNIKSRNFEEMGKNVEQYLKQGIFYFNGRDSLFRPIIITNISKIHELKLSDEILSQCLQYYFQFLYRYMFINGQVQNVIGIIDGGYISPMSLIKPMKLTINFLQSNYKYKLNAIYIINTTNLFQMVYNIAKQFMREDTIRKIMVIQQKDRIQPLLKHCNPFQLEKKFGGLHQNLKEGQFWPPIEFSQNYSNPNLKINLITEHQYKKLYKQGKLIGRKVYRGFIENENQFQSEILFINPNRQPQIKFLASNIENISNNEHSLIQRALKKFSWRRSCFGHDLKNKNMNFRN